MRLQLRSASEGGPYNSPPCGFTAAIDKKEEGSQTDKEDCAADHPDFIGAQRSDLLRREKCKRDAKRGRREAGESGEVESGTVITAALERIAGGDLEKRRERVEEWNQLEYDGQ